MKRKIALLCVMMLAASGVWAQQDTLVLDLKKAIELALSDNPTVRIANLEIERQDYVRKESRGDLLPSLSASGQYTYSVVKQEMAKGLSFGADNTLTATASLSVPLFVPSVYATLRMNRDQLAAAVESARGNRIVLIGDVKNAYYNILLAEQSLAVLESSRRSTASTVESTRASFEQGLVSEYDLLTAEVQLRNLEPSIIEMRNAIESSKLLLKMYLSIPEEIPIEVSGSLDDYREQVLADFDPVGMDLSENTDLRSLELQQQLMGSQIKLAQTARMPVISAFGSAIYTGNDMERINFGSFTGGSDDGSSENGFWWQHPVSVGVQLSIPIFSGLKNTQRVKQLRNSLSQLDLQKEYLAQSLRVQLITARNNLFTAREKMTANEQTVLLAQKAYDISRTRFRTGTGTIVELNLAETKLTEARLSYSQSIFDYLAARVEYDKVIGVEKID